MATANAHPKFDLISSGHVVGAQVVDPERQGDRRNRPLDDR